ncbi:hypothetical protein JRO89_XS02G0041200 [Xanthoceras sorbifolium]|uniref:Knottins-like domain-containing protein n=1 Tax=Xanthoceras sorbifolium TaxID=99658 RepID=A0ABQ8IEE6_9ROSI|nr:hypothetical protein JRO89_XS02G0041200 [Xanthoceras sorbifolium]
MANTLRSVQFFAIFVVFILIASPEMMMTRVEANLCEKASQTWTGKCGNTGHCDNKCRGWERASHGACHKRDKNWKCFCYFDCSKMNTTDHKV